MELTKQAQGRVGVYWHVFPTYSEAKDAVWRDPHMLFNIIPRQLIERINESELIIFFKNKSILELKGADKPERLLGAGPVGVVLDEFAEMKPETWDRIVQPIIRANGGWCWFVGTPKGKNHLFTHYQRGLTPDSEWRSFLLKASQSGIFTQEQLTNAKKTMTEALYNQEIECDFLEGEGSVFRGVRECCISTPQPPIAGNLYVMGVDLAKVTDYTVIVVYDRKTNQQVYQSRFQHLDWPYQKAKIREIAKHYNNALVVLDATGLGDPIADDLIRDRIAVEPFKITEQSKKELIEKLAIWIEQKKMTMIPMDETLQEFDVFSYEISATGRIRYCAPVGFNDDIVLAHSLAIWSLQPIIKVLTPTDIPPIRKAFLRRLGRYDKENQTHQTEWESI